MPNSRTFSYQLTFDLHISLYIKIMCAYAVNGIDSSYKGSIIVGSTPTTALLFVG